MSSPLEIVAAGARTAVGERAESSAAAVRAGISRYREVPFLGLAGEPLIVAVDPGLAPALEGTKRMLPLAEQALAEAIGKLGAQWRRHVLRLRVLLVLPEARPGFTEGDASQLASALRAGLAEHGIDVMLEVAGRGHAGIARAAERALEEQRQESDGLWLLLGVDSYHQAETYFWLESGRRLAQPGVRAGFTPGEGAGCLALASREVRERLGLPSLAGLVGVGTAHEKLLHASETGTFGIGMTQAVLGAIRDLGPDPAIDTLYIDINGERYRSEEWGFVALRTAQIWKCLVYEAPCSAWGDVGAAFGALGSILALRAFARGYARGPRALVMAGSDGGLRGAIILQAPAVS